MRSPPTGAETLKKYTKGRNSGLLYWDILVGSIILLVGNFLSSLAYSKLSQTSSTAITNIARFAILRLVLAMGLKSMGLTDNIVNMAFGFTIGSVSIAAVALAFGYGGKDAAKTITDSWAAKVIKI